MARWLKPEIRGALHELQRHHIAQYLLDVEAIGFKDRGRAYSLFHAFLAPYEVWLQFGFGDSHLTVSRLLWGIAYPLWFWLGWSGSTQDVWRFWPTAGLIVSGLVWLQLPFDMDSSIDHYRTSGAGYSILWRVLMLLLSPLSIGLRIDITSPLSRSAGFRFMDWVFVLIIHPIIVYHVLEWAVVKSPPPGWLDYALDAAFNCLVIRNVLIAIVIPLRNTGLGVPREILEQAVIAQGYVLREQLHQEAANRAAQQEMEEAMEATQRPEHAPADPSRVTPMITQERPQLPAARGSFCPECGAADQARNFCTSCGARLRENDGTS